MKVLKQPWVWGLLRWVQMQHELVECRNENGDCNVPKNNPDNPRLAWWVHTQRQQHKLWKRGEKSKTTSERTLHTMQHAQDC